MKVKTIQAVYQLKLARGLKFSLRKLAHAMYLQRIVSTVKILAQNIDYGYTLTLHQ